MSIVARPLLHNSCTPMKLKSLQCTFAIFTLHLDKDVFHSIFKPQATFFARATYTMSVRPTITPPPWKWCCSFLHFPNHLLSTREVAGWEVCIEATNASAECGTNLFVHVVDHICFLSSAKTHVNIGALTVAYILFQAVVIIVVHITVIVILWYYSDTFLSYHYLSRFKYRLILSRTSFLPQCGVGW